MKNSVTILCILVVSIFSCSANKEDIEKFENQFSNRKGFTTLSMDHQIINFLPEKSKLIGSNERLNDYRPQIEEMVVVSSIPMPKKGVNDFVDDVLSFCMENGYEKAVNIDNPNESSNIFYKFNNDEITGLVIINVDAFTEDVESADAICISGDFSSEGIAKIAKKHGTGHRKLYTEIGKQ